MKTALRSLIALAVLSPVTALAAESVASPDGSLVVSFEVAEGGRPVYSVARRGEPLFAESRLGLVLDKGRSLAEGFAVEGVERNAVDQTWEQPWGECREVRDHHNELRVSLHQPAAEGGLRMVVVARVFNDGFALRYEVPEQPAVEEFHITDELTEFALTGDWPAWWIPAFQGNRYEFVYSHTPIGEADSVHTPVTLQADERTYVSLHEAALVDYSSMALEVGQGNKLKADLFPWSDGVLVRAKAPMKSPWRTVQVADSPSGLVESNLVLNLNEPCKIEDPSWVRPGKYVGVWWEMHVGRATWESGPKHGANTANVKRYMDFAEKHGFDGVLVEGWNVGWDGNWMENGRKFSFTQPYPDFDIEEITRYGAERGVFLIGHHETAGAIPNYERQLEDALSLYERLGVKAVKTGYVVHGPTLERIDDSGESVGEWSHGQYMVRHHQRVVEATARHGVMLVAHEAIKDTGLRRTWPNFLSRECARGQEYNAWSGDTRNPPDHESVLAYTRMLSGPMDYTPGVFDIRLETGDRPDNDRIPSTLAKQLALYVVLYSPMQMACDFPEVYEKHRDALQFILDVPTDWERTVAVDGAIGDYCVIARQQREGDVWCLGAVTDDEARTLQAPLAFLTPGKTYRAEVYRDADDAHWWDNPTAYTIEEREVTSETVLPLRLAPGGGQAVRFVPL